MNTTLFSNTPLPITHIQTDLHQIPLSNLDYLQIVAPSWMPDTGVLRAQLTSLADLYIHGKIVWAVAVQANRLLWNVEPISCPAEIVFDPTGQTPLSELQAVAKKLYQLKHSTPDNPEELAYAQHITSETQYAYFQVPSTISSKPLFTLTFFIWRLHLPNGELTFPYFPILIHPDKQDCATIVPARFWQHSDFYDEWMSNTRHHEAMDIATAFTTIYANTSAWNGLDEQIVYPKLSEMQNVLNGASFTHLPTISPSATQFVRDCVSVIHQDCETQAESKHTESKSSDWVSIIVWILLFVSLYLIIN